jgi:hypothetical protein
MKVFLIYKKSEGMLKQEHHMFVWFHQKVSTTLFVNQAFFVECNPYPFVAGTIGNMATVYFMLGGTSSFRLCLLILFLLITVSAFRQLQ